MRAFKERAEQDPVATIEAVKRVCGRVSIEHASATHEQDRLYVLDKVASTLNFELLNEVCREIIRNALLEAAGFVRADVERTPKPGLAGGERSSTVGLSPLKQGERRGFLLGSTLSYHSFTNGVSVIIVNKPPPPPPLSLVIQLSR